MDFQHVDVFASGPFSGNSLTVFFATAWPAADQMLAITREFRHFESIFITPGANEGRWRARIFDLTQELRFAGHPLLGAAAALHSRLGRGGPRSWSIELPARPVTVQTAFDGGTYRATLDQGRPEYGSPVTAAALAPVLRGLGLSPADLARGLRPAVISTGLAYLLIPVRAEALARAAIAVTDFAARLSAVGAEYVYLLDPERPEGRHWTNDGRVEDIATGSAAGPAGAYLARGGRRPIDRPFILHQGRYAGRPSQLRVEPRGEAGEITQVLVGGDVVLVATGTLRG
jgi:trans-2,3-dihydro-3-hydroxyanthranilate isomerase